MFEFQDVSADTSFMMSAQTLLLEPLSSISIPKLAAAECRAQFVAHPGLEPIASTPCLPCLRSQQQ